MELNDISKDPVIPISCFLCNEPIVPMMGRLFSLLGILLALKGIGQPVQTVRGKVLDEAVQRPLFGAQVVIPGTDPLKGTSTNEKGRFRLEEVPVGRHTIKVSFVGYEPKTLRNVQVSAGKEVVLTIRLKEKVYETEEVEIKARKSKGEALNKLAPVSARQFSVEETQRYAGSRGDPARMAGNFAGVNSASDARNDIIVRGNSPTGVLWRLENIDIPNPNHFASQGATGGPVSILNNNLLADSDFMSGAFPAEYGNRNAAVFDLRMRKGNDEKMEYTGQVGINGFEAGVEGPISKEQGSSFLVNYRYSTLKAFDLLGIRFGVGGVPQYQDMSYKIDLPTQKAGNFSLFGIGGVSNIKLLDSEKNPSDWSFTDSGEDLVFGSDMGVTGINNTHFLGENTFGQTGIAISGSQRRIRIDTLSGNSDPFRTYQYKAFNGKYHFHYTLNHKVNAQHLFKGGIRYKHLFFDHQEKYYQPRRDQYIYQLDDKDNTGLAQGFVHWRYRATGTLTLNTGLYYHQFLLNDSRSLEPRLGMNWAISERDNISLGYGLHSQTHPLVFYFMETYDADEDHYYQTNQNLDFSKSHHFVLGYDRSLGDQYRLKSEVYYQYLFNIPVEGYDQSTSFSMLNTGSGLEGLPQVDSLQNKGTGENYGIELTLEKFFSNNFYFLVTGSYYKSFYEGSNGVVHPTLYAGDYLFNALGGKEFPLGKNGNKILGLNLKYALAGGNRYTPVDEEASRLAGSVVYEEGQAYEKQYKPYSRLDVKINFRVERKKATHEAFFTIENVTDRMNVLRKTWSPKQEEVITDYQLGLFPYGGYRVTF